MTGIGDLYVSCDNLETLAPLSLSVADMLLVSGNAQLQDLSGLDGLISADSLIVSHNAKLERFSALASLAQLNGLAISFNAVLKDRRLSVALRRTAAYRFLKRRDAAPLPLVSALEGAPPAVALLGAGASGSTALAPTLFSRVDEGADPRADSPLRPRSRSELRPS